MKERVTDDTDCNKCTGLKAFLFLLEKERNSESGKRVRVGMK